MAQNTKRQALYTITLVEVTYDHVVKVDVPSMQAGHLRTMRGATALTMRAGRHETRTALLVDVPASEMAEARALVEASTRQANERDGGERYIACERQRGRIIRDRAAKTAAA